MGQDLDRSLGARCFGQGKDGCCEVIPDGRKLLSGKYVGEGLIL